MFRFLSWTPALPGNRAVLHAEIARRLASGSGFPAVFEDISGVVPECFHADLAEVAQAIRQAPVRPLLQHLEESALFEAWELRFMRFGLGSGRVVEVFARICDHYTILAGAGRPLFFGFWIVWLAICLGPVFIGLASSGAINWLGVWLVSGGLLVVGFPLYAWVVRTWIRPDAALWRALKPIPLFRQVQGSRSLYHYLLNLGLCIQAGIPLQRALSLSAEAEVAASFRQKYLKVSADVSAGHPLSTAFQHSGMLQDTLLMVGASELKRSKLWEPGVTDVVKASYSELLKRLRIPLLALLAIAGMVAIFAGGALI